MPEDVLAFLRATSRTRGQAFLQAALDVLARQSGVDLLFAGRYDAKTRSIRLLAAVVDGHPGTPFDRYHLQGTPCENVVDNSTCLHPAGVADEFPKDHLLREGGFEAYVGVPLFGLDGGPVGILVALHRTPLPAPERLAELLELWGDRIGAEIDRAAQFERRTQLERRLAAIERIDARAVMVDGVLHDLHNLLAAVLVHAELLEDSLPPVSPASESARTLLEAARSAAALCQRIRDHTPHDAGRRAHVDLGPILERAVAICKVRAHREIRFDLEIPPDLPRLRATVTEIERIVVNLVSNALDALGDGPGTIRVSARTEPGRAERPRTVCLEVEDDGCGMDEATRARIFEPYFTTKELGRGLGMASVMAVARNLGGEVSVASQPGTGTRVTVCLPAPGGAAKYAADRAEHPERTPPPADDTESARAPDPRCLQRHDRAAPYAARHEAPGYGAAAS